MKLYEVTYQPIVCGPNSNYRNLHDYILAEHQDSVVIEAESKEQAIEKFHQGNNGLIDLVREVA